MNFSGERLGVHVCNVSARVDISRYKTESIGQQRDIAKRELKMFLASEIMKVMIEHSYTIDDLNLYVYKSQYGNEYRVTAEIFVKHGITKQYDKVKHELDKFI